MSASLAVIVLAAGKGTRMRSALPKVLHPVCGVPMAAWVLGAARALNPDRLIVVVGHEADAVREALASPDITFVDQVGLFGTADAVRQCRDAAAGSDTVLVLNGDSPLITNETISPLIEARGRAPLAFLSCEVPDTGAFGRVARDDSGAISGISEQKDGLGAAATAERNAGQYLFEASWLWSHIETVPRQPNGEFYITDLVAAAHREGSPAVAVRGPGEDLMGFDDRVGLAEAERIMRGRILRRHMLNGVTIIDPASTYIDGSVTIEQDVKVLQNCWLAGATSIGTGSVIGPNTTLKSSRIGRDASVEQSVIEDSELLDRVHAGPFSHVRGNSVIGEDCMLGNYAEVNRSVLGRGVKMHHFSYLGDATVGDAANIAAGVITNNYDGTNKLPTVIGAGAFVGCDTMLIAPVTMGPGSQTGAGTVLNRDLEAGMLAVGVPARVIGPRRRPPDGD